MADNGKILQTEELLATRAAILLTFNYACFTRNFTSLFGYVCRRAESVTTVASSHSSEA